MAAISSISRVFTPLFAASLMIFSLGAAAQAPVTIGTYGQHVGGKLVYHHHVTNNGSRNVAKIAIGLDSDETSPNVPGTRVSGELGTVMPVGSDAVNLSINPASVSGPTGWTAEIIQIEDGGRYLQWRFPGYPLPGIQTGQTFRFSVTVPTYDAAYLTGHFSAGYADGKEPWYVNGSMEKLDTTPPILSVTLTPSTIWPPDNKLISVTAAISVTDNYDPQPEIKLESITCNEPLAPGDVSGASLGTDVRQFQLKATRAGNNLAGRIYTITYSATDGSGNKSTTTATVIVPHDKGGK